MTRIIILIVFLTFSITRAQTPATAPARPAENKELSPPQEVTESFTKEFPEVTPVWKMDGKNFRAEFVDPETFRGRSITYDPEGKVIRRESEMENSSYPQAINDYYIRKYPGEKFRTWTSEDEKGETAYYIRRNGEIVWFDSKGQPVEAKK